MAQSTYGQGVSAAAAQGQIERSRLPDATLPVDGGMSLGQPAEGNTALAPTAPVTGGDNDLGVQSLLRAPERPQPWSLFADGGFIFTTNAALTRDNAQSDVFFVGEGGAGYEWKLGADTTLSAAVREQYFAYNRFNQLDFGSLNAAVALAYTMHQLDDVVFSAQLGFTRLTHSSLIDREFYRNGSLSLGAQKLFPLGRAQLISIGGDIQLGLSVPHVSEREEFGVSGAYIVQCTRHLSAQAGGRIAYYLYAASGRQDVNFSASAGLTYAFTPWCSLGATLAGTVDRSDHEVFAYDVLDTGASAFFRFRF